MVCHADVVKNRYMTQPDVNPPRFPTVRSVAKYVYQTEGLIGFYRGKQAAVNKLIYNIWFPFCLTSFAKSKTMSPSPSIRIPAFLLESVPNQCFSGFGFRDCYEVITTIEYIDYTHRHLYTIDKKLHLFSCIFWFTPHRTANMI